MPEEINFTKKKGFHGSQFWRFKAKTWVGLLVSPLSRLLMARRLVGGGAGGAQTVETGHGEPGSREVEPHSAFSIRRPAQTASGVYASYSLPHL